MNNTTSILRIKMWHVLASAVFVLATFLNSPTLFASDAVLVGIGENEEGETVVVERQNYFWDHEAEVLVDDISNKLKFDMGYGNHPSSEVASLIDNISDADVKLALRYSKKDLPQWIDQQYPPISECSHDSQLKRIVCEFDIERLFSCRGLDSKYNPAEARLEFQVDAETKYYTSNYHNLNDMKVKYEGECDIGKCEEIADLTCGGDVESIQIAGSITAVDLGPFNKIFISEHESQCVVTDGGMGFECSLKYDDEYPKKLVMDDKYCDMDELTADVKKQKDKLEELKCAADPKGLNCDFDKDGVVNRLDPCIDTPEAFEEGSRTPLDGINDGCPNSSLGGQTGQKYSKSNNSFDQAGGGGGSAYPKGGYLSSGGSKCSFVQGSTFSLAEVILMLMPLIVISLGYMRVPGRVKESIQRRVLKKNDSR
ncbi:MAG: hypothetical protein HN337_03710 [Deltaproteobacteria bacterium]|nr:hypothetical protein [Deltaproteobacteria bacterium]